MQLPGTIRYVAERLGQVDSNPASYFKGLEFRYVNADRLLRMKVRLISLIHS
jgi:hypothetical protein